MAITQYTVPSTLVDAKSQNVKDLYKGWLAEDVRADLAPKRSKAVMVFMNLTHDFNKSTAIRINNCLMGQEVYLVGRRKYDRRGTVGTHHYETVFHADTFEEVFEKLRGEGYHFLAVDNIMEHEPKNLMDVELPEKTAFVFGEEQLGLSQEVIARCDSMAYIASEGSCRSLNVASAAAIVLYEYSRQHR